MFSAKYYLKQSSKITYQIIYFVSSERFLSIVTVVLLLQFVFDVAVMFTVAQICLQSIQSQVLVKSATFSNNIFALIVFVLMILLVILMNLSSIALILSNLLSLVSRSLINQIVKPQSFPNLNTLHKFYEIIQCKQIKTIQNSYNQLPSSNKQNPNIFDITLSRLTQSTFITSYSKQQSPFLPMHCIKYYFILFHNSWLSQAYLLMSWNQTQPQKCSIPFLDCRGYYDLAAEIVGCMATAVLLVWTINNYRGLKKQKGEDDITEYQHSLRRKIRINLMNIIFLTFFLAHISFSMILFQISNERGSESITNDKLDLWYKLTQVVFIELLNAMLLTVGWLYWKGLHAFFVIKQIKAPCLYRKWIMYCFAVSYLYLLLATIASAVLLLTYDAQQSELMMINVLMLASCLIAVTFFITFRLLYYKNIVMSVKLKTHTVKRQRIYNTLIVLTSLARIAMSFLSIFQVNWDSVRSYQSGQCHDTRPFHAMILIGMTFLVDLLPSFIFTRIFTTFQRRKGHHSDVQKTLFSAQPSDLSAVEL